MRDAVLTLRVPLPLRKRLEALARKEKRSLSGQVEYLVERALAEGGSAGPRGRPLAGLFEGKGTPAQDDFRRARAALSASLIRRSRNPADPRR